MFASAIFREERSGSSIVLNKPLRPAGRRSHQQQLRICCVPAEVLDVRAGQSATANKSITWRARPTRFDGQRTDAAAQREQRADHRRVPKAKTMSVLLFDLHTSAGTVSFARKCGEGSQE